MEGSFTNMWTVSHIILGEINAIGSVEEFKCKQETQVIAYEQVLRLIRKSILNKFP